MQMEIPIIRRVVWNYKVHCQMLSAFKKGARGELSLPAWGAFISRVAGLESAPSHVDEDRSYDGLGTSPAVWRTVCRRYAECAGLVTILYECLLQSMSLCVCVNNLWLYVVGPWMGFERSRAGSQVAQMSKGRESGTANVYGEEKDSRSNGEEKGERNS